MLNMLLLLYSFRMVRLLSMTLAKVTAMTAVILTVVWLCSRTRIILFGWTVSTLEDMVCNWGY